MKIDVGGETHEVDLVCIAAGRGADVEGLGLDDAGIETDDRGLIKVDGAHAHLARTASTQSATSCPAPRWPTRPPTRA